jgi:hypothetical protein
MRNHSTIWFASGFDWLTMICESECQTKRTHVKSWWGQNRERHRIGRLAPRDLGQSLQRRFMNRPSKTPGVCRIDQPSHRTHGFFVRVHHRGKIHPAFFADKKHGGKAAALAAALAHHLKLRQKLGMPPQISRRWNSEVVRRRGKSGINGVRRAIIIGQSGRRLKSWIATWSPALGVVRRKQFSIRKHGEAEAKRLAIRARRAGLRSMK